MSETDEIVVELEKPTEAEVKPADDPIADLKAQYDELQADKERNTQRAEAEAQRAATAEQQLQATKRDLEATRTEVTDTRLNTVEQGIAAAQQASASAKAAVKTAMESGDWSAVAEAQEQLADARARLVRLDEAKSELEAYKATKPQEPPADPIEAFIQSRTPETARWLRAHREYLTDPDKSNFLQEAHFNATGPRNKLQQGTPAYFDHLEKFLGLKEEEPVNKPAKAAPANGNGTTPRRASAPVAPVSASASSTTGGGPTVKLTSNEARAATDGTHVWGRHDLAAGRIKDAKLVGEPIGTQEFARRKHELTKQGQYDRSYLEQ